MISYSINYRMYYTSRYYSVVDDDMRYFTIQHCTITEHILHVRFEKLKQWCADTAASKKLLGAV